MFIWTAGDVFNVVLGVAILIGLIKLFWPLIVRRSR